METKRALWSLQLHASGYQPARLPSDLRPMPIDQAVDIACAAKDEHAAQRRLRILHRFRPDLFRPGKDEGKPAPPACDDATEGERRRSWHAECARRFRTRPPSGTARRRSFDGPIGRVGVKVTADLNDDDRVAICVPTADDPNYDPVRGTSSLYSTLRTRRKMAFDLAQLLDPRGWDNCSDLFEDSFEVVPDGHGGYREKPTPPEAYGRSWQGLLYEFADVGPQAVQNILWVRFAVTRVCDEEIPYYLCPPPEGTGRPMRGSGARAGADYKDYAWRRDRYPNRDARNRAGPSHAGVECDCEVDAVEIQYELHDSLSYRVGPLTLPGMMRRNSGYLRAWSCEDGYTDIQCKKDIHFGRLTRWNAAGAFDFGEILNYTAAAFLSLWIGNVEQIVPCCQQAKAIPTG